VSRCQAEYEAKAAKPIMLEISESFELAQTACSLVLMEVDEVYAMKPNARRFKVW
jgi:hypothetical protein